MTEIEWIPQENVLQKVLELLQDSFIPDSNVQKDVQIKLSLLQTNTDFVKYFLLIFEGNGTFDDKTRALAGLILKNNISCSYEVTSKEIIEMIQDKSLKLLVDPNKEIRLSASAIITVLALKGGVENWPELLTNLSNMLHLSNEDIRIATVKTLINICEDYLSQRYYIATNLEEPIKKLLLQFIELTSNSDRNVRLHSFMILNDCLQKFYDTINDSFDSVKYLQCLINAANDKDEDIIISVCQGFTTYINNKDSFVLPYIDSIIKYMLIKTSDHNAEIALQACEFWLSMTKLPLCKELLGNYIQDLVKILLKNMKYSDFEITILKSSLGKDYDIADKDVHPCSRYDDDVDEDFDIGWTIRKCSAASLDELSVHFQESMTEILLPLLIEMLDNSDLLIKESGILAFGAVSEGCVKSLNKYLSTLIPPLIKLIDHPYSLIRSITCWTLSRYLKFVIDSPERELYFESVLTGLLRHCLDENKRVQKAAISSLCFFLEEAKTEIIPYVDLLVQAFLQAFHIYNARSLNILYDAIGVLAEVMIRDFRTISDKLMPPLVYKFTTIDEFKNHEEFLSLCECFSCIVSAIDVEFLPYTEAVYLKCSTITASTTQQGSACDKEFDKDILAGTLGLLIAMTSNLKTYFTKFIINSNLMDHLFYAIQDEPVQVRQPALALLGEIVRSNYSFIHNQIQIYIPTIIENLDIGFHGACNNAAWLLGKLCIAMGSSISSYTAQIMPRFVEIMMESDGSQTVYQTIAITVCTFGLVCPDEVAAHLKILMKPLCLTLRNVVDCEDKEIAFRGLCDVCLRNPEVLANEFIYFCDAIASWSYVNFELKERITRMLVGFRDHVGVENWNSVYGNFPDLLKNRIANLYNV